MSLLNLAKYVFYQILLLAVVLVVIQLMGYPAITMLLQFVQFFIDYPILLQIGGMIFLVLIVFLLSKNVEKEFGELFKH